MDNSTSFLFQTRYKDVSKIMHLSNTYMLLNKVLHHSLLFLYILNFKYLWNLEKNLIQLKILENVP